ncbi:MAG: hypothetical protein H0T60_18710 [Acidobacteria bacterium]|nr:hypothetical protein [Acidobacteriota bacterium]
MKSIEAVVNDGAAVDAAVDAAAATPRKFSGRAAGVGLLAIACAGVLAGAALTKMLLRVRADRQWDGQVERFRAHGAM